MQSLADIFKRKSNRSPLIRGINAAMTVEKVNLILAGLFGEKIIDTARAVYLKNHVITIACLSSVAAQEMRLHEAEIIEQINKKTEAGTVQKIRFLA